MLKFYQIIRYRLIEDFHGQSIHDREDHPNFLSVIRNCRDDYLINELVEMMQSIVSLATIPKKGTE
ncbi:hypothetical protein I3760_15G043900 [Carya illinoinensis]|nr:hypothetical protein I3760_15G043900 [Carya illinoinensis]